jgi:phosphopantetheinyl transferase (holo-ACP synthase)
VKSAGNDIVALTAIDIQRTRDIRFYSKFITDSELAIYQQLQSPSLPFEIFVWLLWSVKESVYKYLQRHNAGLIFSPAKIIIQQVTAPGHPILSFNGTEWNSDNNAENFYTGTVTSGSHQLYFRSKIHQEFIATVVTTDEQFENVYWGIKSIDQTNSEHQSKAVRELVLAKLQAFLGIDSLQIVKSEIGYPVVLDGGTPLEVALSFAHHDRFVGYSFAL